MTLHETIRLAIQKAQENHSETLPFGIDFACIYHSEESGWHLASEDEVPETGYIALDYEEMLATVYANMPDEEVEETIKWVLDTMPYNDLNDRPQ